MNKVELLATFRTPATIESDRRWRDRIRSAVWYVRFRREPEQRIECSCGCTLPYSPTEHDVSQLTVLAKICPHIEALYRGGAMNATITEFGREMFQWCWAQQALERST